jgi:hypothetical protein
VKIRLPVAAVSCALVLAVAGRVPAHAGPYADALSKCLVDNTTQQDQANLVRWMFASAAQNPNVSDIASISEDQRTAMTKQTAALFERLLTQDCKSEFKDVKDNEEGEQPLATSFAMLISVAMRGLIEDPSVSRALGSIDGDLHRDKINDALRGTDEQGTDQKRPGEPRPDQPGPPPPDSGGGVQPGDSQVIPDAAPDLVAGSGPDVQPGPEPDTDPEPVTGE